MTFLSMKCRKEVCKKTNKQTHKTHENSLDKINVSLRNELNKANTTNGVSGNITERYFTGLENLRDIFSAYRLIRLCHSLLRRVLVSN